MHQRQDVHLSETIQSAQVGYVLQMYLIVVCFIQHQFAVNDSVSLDGHARISMLARIAVAPSSSYELNVASRIITDRATADKGSKEPRIAVIDGITYSVLLR